MLDSFEMGFVFQQYDRVSKVMDFDCAEQHHEDLCEAVQEEVCEWQEETESCVASFAKHTRGLTIVRDWYLAIFIILVLQFVLPLFLVCFRKYLCSCCFDQDGTKWKNSWTGEISFHDKVVCRALSSFLNFVIVIIVFLRSLFHSFAQDLFNIFFLFTSPPALQCLL
eukprot:m.153707 g.153707  ORF g.153707 m.153707 type:complete len:167 (+) comp20766_c0_seq4:689-1189(+)